MSMTHLCYTGSFIEASVILYLLEHNVFRRCLLYSWPAISPPQSIIKNKIYFIAKWIFGQPNLGNDQGIKTRKMHQLLFICYYNNYDSWRWYHNWILQLMVQPGGNMWKCSMNIQVSVALKRTVIGSSWCFDHLSSHSDDERKGPDHSHYHSGDDFCLSCRNISH